MANDTKIFKIKIDGLEQSVEYTKLLAESFLAVERNIVKSNVAIQTFRESIQLASRSIDVNLLKSTNTLLSTASNVGKVLTKGISSLRNTLSDTSSLIKEISIDDLAKKASEGLSKVDEFTKKLNDSVAKASESAVGKTQETKIALEKEIKELTKKKENFEKNGIDEDGNKIKPNDAYITQKNDGEIQKLAGQATVKGSFGIIDYDRTRENLDLVIKEYEKYKAYKDKLYEYENQKNEKDIELKKDNKEEHAKALAAKAAADAKYKNESIQIDNALLKAKNESGALLGDAMESSVKAVTDYSKKITDGLTAGLNFMKGTSAAQLEMIEKDLNKTTEKYNKSVEERKKSDTALADLQNKAANLSGGRSAAMQEQIDAEMAKNEELKAQESRLAAEKEKLEKKKAKEEKKKKKIEIAQGIVSSTASIAQGIAQALALGPIAGPIMAAMLAAMGAIQIATQVKQLESIDKKADGGLLRGRRHSDGGMRIEGTNIEVEGGEYVINRRTTDHNLGLIRYINSQRRPLGESDLHSFFRSPQQVHVPAWRGQMENGGMMPVVEQPSMSTDNVQLIDAIRNIRIDSRVAVTDIIRAQDQMTAVDSWVGM